MRFYFLPYIETVDRTQLMMYSLDSFVELDSTARLIDAFVDSPNLDKFSQYELSSIAVPDLCAPWGTTYH